jgi:hypothetical protein
LKRGITRLLSGKPPRMRLGYRRQMCVADELERMGEWWIV